MKFKEFIEGHRDWGTTLLPPTATGYCKLCEAALTDQDYEAYQSAILELEPDEDPEELEGICASCLMDMF
jgi:hypothetical protein